MKSVGKTSFSRFIPVVSRKFSFSKLENFTMIENSHVMGGEISILDKGKTSRSIMNKIFFSNVYFESSQKRILVENQTITLKNITILGTLNGILIHNCAYACSYIKGTLSFLRN